MQLSMTMLTSQIVLLVCIQGTIAQEGACDFNNRDPRGVFCKSIDAFIDDRPEGRFFEALKNVESQRDFCKISKDRNKIGLYQISEEYYNEAVCFNKELAMNGKFIMQHSYSKLAV